jgi:sugar O-acyltransferase (sialic acid O-acetyltransferase NeuD family)
LKNKQLIVFGTGQQSDIATYYLNKLSIDIACFCVDEKFYKKNTFKKKKVISTNQLLNRYEPSQYKIHVALTYKGLNQLRFDKYSLFKRKGYEFQNIIYNSNLDLKNSKVGENVVILDSFIQPYTKIGNNTFIWSGTTVGHHSSLGNNCWISSGTTIGGNCKINDFNFLGLNSTIGHFVSIGKKCFIGSSSHITRNISAQNVVIQNDSKKILFDPEKFLQINEFK